MSLFSLLIHADVWDRPKFGHERHVKAQLSNLAFSQLTDGLLSEEGDLRLVLTACTDRTYAEMKREERQE